MSINKLMSVGALVFALGLSLLSCEGDGKTIIRVGDTWSPTHPVARAIDEVFKPQVEALSEGMIRVEVYHSGMLGNEQTLWDSVRNGAIEMVIVGSVMNSEFRPMLLADWPFLYRDLDHARNVWTGDFAENFIDDFNAFFPSVKLLAVGPNSARTFTSNRSLTGVADFRGQKFRVPANPIHTGIVTDLGASAQVVPLNDLFSALQTGVVDGQDNGMVTVLSENLNEVQRYLLETNHIVATMQLVVNANFFNRLSSEHQAIVMDAAHSAALWAWDKYIQSVDADRATLVNSGIVVTPLSATDRVAIIDAIQPTLNKLYSENAWARDLTNQARAVQ